eukprot:TRINITY_DN82600_c0_g1_i1.p1 TRINITY_DN82600_c0_g1~~TRINITY_DN82600_c0_g1_i1.p1  ORF type:complete len:593 (-),score=93.64 TRINITY_DN82600_c0_g1_i1:72-1796(-)
MASRCFRRARDTPLIVEQSEQDRVLRFCKDELKAMLALGWPIAVSMFCRFAMFSMDAAFVGHITRTHPTGAAITPPRALNVLGLVPAEGATLWTAEMSSTMLSGVSSHGQKEYLAAASLSDMLTSLLVVPLLALAFGLQPLVAQSMGSGNLKMAGTWLQLSLFCVTLATIPSLVAFFFVGDLLHALDFDPEVCDLAGTYAKFSSIWVIPNSWYVAMRFYFQAQGKARPAMYCGIAFVLMNAILLWVLVFGGPGGGSWWVPGGLGFIGAAISISSSRCIQCFVYWLYMFVWKAAHQPTWPGFSCSFLQTKHLRPYLAQVLPQVGTMLLQFFINQSTALLVARLGVLQVAASSAATQATMPLTLCLLGTFSALGAIRVGMKLGKGDATAARHTAWLCIGSGISMTMAVAVVILPLRHLAMSLMTSDSQVQQLAAELMTPIMLNFLAAGIVQTGTGGILASQGRTTLSTVLAVFFELPLSLGSIATLVLVFHADVRLVYWVQASVSMLEALVVVFIVSRSDWERYAREAQARNQRSQEQQEEAEEVQSSEVHRVEASIGGSKSGEEPSAASARAAGA